MFFKDEEIALTVLRLSVGMIFTAHAVLKFAVFGLVGAGQWFDVMGLWSFLVYPVTILEFVCGVALIIGFYPRWAALALMPVTAGIFWVHADNGWVFSSSNGGWEYPALLFVCLTVILVGGSGKYVLSKD